MSLAMMNAVESIETIEIPALQVFWYCSNPFEMYNEEEFKQHFCFKK